LLGLDPGQLGHIPREAEKYTWDRFEFEVIDMDKRRVDKVLIARTPAAGAGKSERV
jgi:putative hemolysin